jgi:hypothetical protein
MRSSCKWISKINISLVWFESIGVAFNIGFVENSRVKNVTSIISFFEESLQNMTNLVKDVRDKIPAYMYTGPTMTEEERLSAFLKAHQEEIVNWVSNKVQTQFKVKGNMFDRTTNLVNQEYPYGQRIDNIHRLLTNAIMCSLWCGWFSQAAQDSNFHSEYVKKFRNSILEAFDIGAKFAAPKP